MPRCASSIGTSAVNSICPETRARRSGDVARVHCLRHAVLARSRSLRSSSLCRRAALEYVVAGAAMVFPSLRLEGDGLDCCDSGLRTLMRAGSGINAYQSRSVRLRAKGHILALRRRAAARRQARWLVTYGRGNGSGTSSRGTGRTGPDDVLPPVRPVLPGGGPRECSTYACNELSRAALFPHPVYGVKASRRGRPRA